MSEQAIIIDANQMISTLLGGKALDILFSGHFRIYTTERKTWEVKRYIPFISQKISVSEEQARRTFELFPVESFHDAFFVDRLPAAHALIGARDETDVDLVALALKLQYPIWSHDRDFQGLATISVVTTEDLLSLIEGA